MKQTIKNFLFKKRIKILKSKRGFSLIEVLVAVAIIGIISAIAVPQFTANKNEAAKVAVDTSAGNIAKAFKNCMALGTFATCNNMDAIKVSCPAGAICDSGGPTGGASFCAHIHKGGQGNDFKVCVQINPVSGAESRTYGGALVGSAVCHKTKGDSTPGNLSCDADSGDVDVTQTACPNGVSDCSGAVTASNTACAVTLTCSVPTTAGDCNKTAGTCS